MHSVFSTQHWTPFEMAVQKNNQDIEYEFSSKAQFSQDVLGSVTMAWHSGGLLQTFHFIAEHYPVQLTEVLSTFSGRSRPFYLLYPQNRYLPLRVKALITFLKNEINPHSQQQTFVKL